MTHNYIWGDLRDHAIQRFGEAPGAQLEQQIIDTWKQHPAIVTALVDTIAARVDAGKVRSGWAILATECERATTTSNERAQDTTERTRAETRTRQWMHAAGMHYDRWPEVEDELFGETGNLRHWPELKDTMHNLWHELRPEGERTEQEALERAAKYVAINPPGPPPEHRPHPITLPTLPQMATVATPADNDDIPLP